MKKLNISSVALELTTRCNQNCIYCYNIWKNPHFNHPHFHASFRQAKTLVKKLTKQINIKSITLTGGEPQLFDRLAELVIYIRMRGIRVSLISNASRFDKDKLDLLIASKVDIFEFTVNSLNPIVHNTMTGGESNWENTIQSLKYLISEKQHIAVAIVITKQNVDTVLDTIDYLISLGVKNLMINRYNPGGAAVDTYKDIMVDNDKLQELYAKINEKANNVDCNFSSNVCTPFCILEPKKYENIRFGHCSYNIEQKMLVIDALGNWRFCNHSPQILGNIHQSHISEIVENEKFKQWETVETEICAKCKYLEICRGGCLAASEQINLDRSIDPILDKSR